MGDVDKGLCPLSSKNKCQQKFINKNQDLLNSSSGSDIFTCKTFDVMPGFYKVLQGLVNILTRLIHFNDVFL